MRLSKLKEIFAMSKKLGFAAVFVVAMMGLNMQSAKSALTDKGLLHPINHFPTWFSDASGVTLQLCLDGDGATGLCFFDPVIQGNALSQATGFGAEAFWWSADATLDMAGGGRAILVLGLEAAYANGDPAPNDQFAFGRVRLRVDIPADGEYKIWHPALNEVNGCQPEIYNATAGIKSINVTRDIGGGVPFETMLAGEIGPFLTWDPAISPPAPAGYVGDPNVDHEVVGGHCGINYFRIEAPVGVDLDGNGNNFVQTNVFSVQGKIYDEANTPPGIESVRTSYFRSTGQAGAGVTTARINSWVKAPHTAKVVLSGLTQANQNGAMASDGENTFFKRATLNAANSISIPNQLTVTATSLNGMSTVQVVNVVDQVNIETATWVKATGRLRVIAFSSDKIHPFTGVDIPVFTLHIGTATYAMPQVGPVGRYEVVLNGFLVPPARVTVTSSKGGVDTEGLAD